MLRNRRQRTASGVKLVRHACVFRNSVEGLGTDVWANVVHDHATDAAPTTPAGVNTSPRWLSPSILWITDTATELT